MESRLNLNLERDFDEARAETKQHRAWKDRNLSAVYDWLKNWNRANRPNCML